MAPRALEAEEESECFESLSMNGENLKLSNSDSVHPEPVEGFL
jgi:hypothetical protein